MAKLPAERAGTPLHVKKRDVEFSFWPMGRGTHRYGLQSRLFAADPFNVIEQSVIRDCPAAVRPLAVAFVEQAEDFFAASQLGAVRSARPLLLYYSFMNLAKAFVLTRLTVPTLGDTYHGLQSTFPALGAGPAGASVTAYPSTAARANLFDLLLRTITGAGLVGNVTYDLERMLPQILLGHRLWCEAANDSERFIEIDNVRILDDRANMRCWPVFDLARADCSRLGYTQAKIITGARLGQAWTAVKTTNGEMLRFEAMAPKAYNHRPSDVVNGMVEDVRRYFWRSVSIVKPFRRYYVYVAQQNDLIIPQLCSIYLIMFYLGSITRYRPNHFDDLVVGKYGGFIQEFIEVQPNQWLYLMASEFAQQEVTRAAVV